MSDYVGAAVPCKNPEKLIASIGRKICFVNRATGEMEELCSVEPDKPENRINDSKCDTSGRYWCGTMAIKQDREKNGNFYSYDGKSLCHHLPDIGISNGMDWSLDNSTMYYVDSTPKKVYSFKYDPSMGKISDQKVIIDYESDPSLGFPDGMCIDSEGKLWIACFAGGCVTRWDPDTGERLLQVSIPAYQVTSCCFGGPNYDVLYVTSASVSPSPDAVKYPHPGAIFAVTGLGVKGLPSNVFDDTKI